MPATSPLRVAVVSDSGSDGGAGVAATRLSRGLRRAGHEVALLYRADFAVDPDAADVLLPVRHRWVWWGRLMSVVRSEAVRRAVQRSWVAAVGGALARFRPDVISVHNLHRAEWDIEVVEACLGIAPVAWTLHDMWAVTGGCAYASGCRRFETRCDRRCPQAGQAPTPPKGWIQRSFQRRRRLLGRHPRLVFVSPSRWLAGEVRAAAGLETELAVIANGLDLDIFRPLERRTVRDLLGMNGDDDSPVLATAAASLDDPRKGLRALLEALGQLSHRRVRLVLLGAGGALDAPANIELVRLGPVRGDALLAIAHSTADLFVLPSRDDNQPLVLLESMACSVPSVGVATGGVPELILPARTGWLASGADPVPLAEALRRALAERDSWTDRGAAARAFVEEHHDLAAQVERYSELFMTLRERSPERR